MLKIKDNTCKFCNDEQLKLSPVDSNSSIHINYDECHDKAYLYIYNEVKENDGYNSIWAKEIHHCPMCGRKLNKIEVSNE